MCTECGHTCQAGRESESWWAPAVSFLLLVVGMVWRYREIGWFADPWIEASWFLLSFLPVGFPVVREAWEAAVRKDFFSEFSLMLIASIGAFAIGEYPEAVAVMLFYTIGERLQERTVDKASRNIQDLLEVRPERAEVWRDGAYQSVSPRTVKVGERIEVKPGGRVPLDGVLLDEEASFDTSALTGESLPRMIGRDGEVLAGMIVRGQAIRLRVSRPYDQSALARILSLVKDAAERKAPTELFIRRFARVYTPLVILLSGLIVSIPALVGLFSSTFTYHFSEWLYRGLVFLVISCPCALVISVPLGYFAGIGTASRLGILFKGGNYLDAISRINTVAFDKTGTLTTGRFEVTAVESGSLPVDESLALAASVERKSAHPVAVAIARYAEERNIPVYEPSEVSEIAGYGVEAKVNGRQVLVGNIRLLEERGIPVPEHLSREISTVVVCAVDGEFAGSLSLADVPKEDAGKAIRRLRKLGVGEICLLSGDRQEIVDGMARRLGIGSAYGDLLPEDKVRCVGRIAAMPGRRVAFVGDGMNDAPVLALSHVGIAMGGLGSDAAIESADVVIQTDQPSKVADAIAIGRFTRSVVRQNIVGAIGLKVVVLAAGALGFATLWGAVFADVGGALLAVLNAMRVARVRL